MKKTLQEKLHSRKLKRPPLLIYNILGYLWKFMYKKKLNVNFDYKIKLKDYKGPYIVVSNHASRMDYIYTGVAFLPHRLNYVAGYNEFFRSHLAFIFRLLKVIPKKNFVADIYAIQEFKRILKKNGKVIIFPEGMSSIGGTNQPSMIGSAKLLKHCKVPVLMTKISGGYLTNTKYCLDERYGRVDVVIDELFSVEDLRVLTEEQIGEKMDEAIYNNDYEYNKKMRVKYNGKGRMAHNLHHLLYHCPKCHNDLTMSGHDNIIECTNCNNKAILNEYYDLIPDNDNCVIPDTPAKWFDLERSIMKEKVKDPNFKLEEEVEIGVLPKYEYLKNMETSQKVGRGLLTLDRNGLTFEGTKNNEKFSFFIESKNLPTYGMCTDVTFFYTFFEGEYYEFNPTRESTAIWLHATEEMHRLNGGKWQDFSWKQ